MGRTRSFCRICIANCGIIVETDGDRVLSVKGDPDHPVSAGYTCPKGRALADAHHGERRLTGPLLRRDGVLTPATVDEAYTDAAAALAHVIEAHGPGAVGTFVGGGGFVDPAAMFALRRWQHQLGSAQNYSTASVDSVAKTYVAALVAGTVALVPHPDELGTLLLLIGSNPIVSHGQTTGFANPVERLRAARARGEVYVIDPRVTETARSADHHLAARPGTDFAIVAHVLRELLDGDVDESRLAGRAVHLDELRAAVAPFDAAPTAVLTGVDLDDLRALVASVRRAGRLAVITGTGVSMSPAGNLTEWLVWALMIVTDSFDQPGGMWFNPGCFTRIDQRDTLPAVRLDEAGPPSRPELLRLNGEWPAAVIADEIASGRLRALVVLGANPVVTLPDTDGIVEALAKLDALVVIEVDRTETTDLATHVFGTQDQLERPDVQALDMFAGQVVAQYADAAVTAPPSRPAAWRIITELAGRLGHHVLPSGLDAGSDALDVLRRTVRGYDLDALRAAGGTAVDAVARYGWAEAKLPRGTWDLAPEPLVAQLATTAAPPDLALTPRRQARHLNSQSFRSGDEASALFHPDDAARHDLADGDLVEVTGDAGTLCLTARVTDGNVRGSVSIPHGFADTNVNRLIGHLRTDPFTGMPHLSGAPVTVRRVPVDHT